MELLKRINEAIVIARSCHEYYTRYAPDPVLMPMLGPQLPSAPEELQTVDSDERQPIAA